LKNIINKQEDRHLEPFNTIMELAINHGHFAILESLYELLEFERQQISHCVKCYRKTELLHTGLGQLLRTYGREFPPRVELVGEGLIQ
jgi:hypothetical protein